MQENNEQWLARHKSVVYYLEDTVAISYLSPIGEVCNSSGRTLEDAIARAQRLIELQGGENAEVN